MFGVLIPGSVIQYNFEVVQDKGVITIPNPKSINVIGFFMNRPLDNVTAGASLYFSAPPYDGMEFIGAIANSRPSDIFHTGWSLNPSVNIHSELKLVVQIEPLQNLETSVKIKEETDMNKNFAQKVALNLYNYLQSFNRNENAA
mmetsp:Transcript_39670/g.38245  ORF Transcript_39670/g.38245 Transcript_39670/m.38245 type:complete len:144 (+) Transcript_39670:14-445(+)